MVAKDPEVLLDVGGDVHHAGPHTGLHLPVSKLTKTLVQHDGPGHRRVRYHR